MPRTKNNLKKKHTQGLWIQIKTTPLTLGVKEGLRVRCVQWG
jgi:hypothetical protein